MSGGRVRAALRSAARWIVEGLSADHTWCWGYVCSAVPSPAWQDGQISTVMDSDNMIPLL